MWKKVMKEVPSKIGFHKQIKELEQNCENLGIDKVSVASESEDEQNHIPTFGSYPDLKLSKRKINNESFSFGCEIFENFE